MGFFQHLPGLRRNKTPRLAHSVYGEICLWTRLGQWLALFAGGALAAAAFPPCNCTAGVFAGLMILFLTVRNWNWLRAAFGGWVWGGGYALFSFMWLREIHPAVPVFMMIVLGAYYIPVGWTAAVLHRWLLLPEAVRAAGFSAQRRYRDFALWRQLLWCMGVSSSLILVEYARHTVLPWNYLGVAFWKNLPLMQAVRWCGVYVVSFAAAFTAAALALAVLTIARRDDDGKLRYHRPWPLFFAFGMLALFFAFGVRSMELRKREYAQFQHCKTLTLVQGAVPVNRGGGTDAVREAIARYAGLSMTQLGKPTDLVVWPETAVPYPLRGAHPVCREYRDAVAKLTAAFHKPFLIGTLEFDMSVDPPGSLNSAVLVGEGDLLTHGYLGIYSKTHPVPFGEFVPLRRYLPQWIIRLIDMNRDLTPGKSFAPLQPDAELRIGAVICFEDVFPDITRKELAEGANLLLVISEDGWYPTSSEPEQHLANAIPRAIETGLPMVRSGNDSATCLITPSGFIRWSMAETLTLGKGRAFDRGMGAATVSVQVPDTAQIKPTFYARCGDWFVGAAAILLALEFIAAWRRRLNRATDRSDAFTVRKN